MRDLSEWEQGAIESHAFMGRLIADGIDMYPGYDEDGDVG